MKGRDTPLTASSVEKLSHVISRFSNSLRKMTANVTFSSQHSKVKYSYLPPEKWRKDSSDQNEFTLIPDESVGSDEGDAPAGSSMVAISFNFINSIIGSGLIGMPFALQQAGLGIGVLIFLVVGVAADYSVMLLINAGDLSGTRSYQELMDVTFGRPGFYGVTVLQFLLPFLATVSYNVVIGDAITKVLTRVAGAHLVDTPFSHRQFVIVFVTLTVTLPLSLYRDVGKLGKWSGLSLIFTLFNIFVVFFRLGTSSYISPTVDAYDISHSNMSQALGLVGLGIVCHHNSFVLYSSLDRPTPARWRVVTHVSEFAATLLMLVFALGGYLTFTGYTQGDILENFCSGDDLGNMARLAFAVIVMMTFPLDCFVAREVLENALSYGSKSVGPTSLQRHVLLTILLVSAITAVSMVTDCVGIVMELNGVLVASPLAFMIPAICMIRLRPHGIFCAANIGPLITFFFGLLLSTAGLATVSMEIYKGVSCSHGKEMPYCPAQHTLPSHTSETGLQR